MLSRIQFASLVCAFLTCAFPLCRYASAAPGELIVSLSADDPSAATATWANQGSLGAFALSGTASKANVDGVSAVQFDGKSGFYVGPKSVPEIDGNAPRTIEVWAYCTSADDEGALVSWGKRGGPNDTLIAFGWGRNESYGAMAHWADDLGWKGVPSTHHFHLLAYTFDGHVASLYDDGQLKNSRAVAVDTAATFPIVIDGENAPNGAPTQTNEFTNGSLAANAAIASVQICSGAKTASQIEADFERDAAKYHASKADTLGMLAAGIQTLRGGGFDLSLLNGTQVAVSLKPAGGSFDFLPFDRVSQRSAEGFTYLGDVNLRWRNPGGDWQSASSARSRFSMPSLPAAPAVLAATDISSSLGDHFPLRVVRTWGVVAGKLTLSFSIQNISALPVEIGALGFPMVFNNIITDRSLDEAHNTCSFTDPYIGGTAGYVQVTRLNGAGPALLVLPDAKTSFEAYRPLYEDPTPRGVTFEGFYEWMAHTKAYAENEWKGVNEWNPATSRVLAPGAVATYGFQFVLAPSVKQIQNTLIANDRPYAIGVPGYVLATDQPGRLFLHTPSAVVSAAVQPSGLLQVSARPARTPHGWLAYQLTALKPGRCRLEIRYASGVVQEIHYNVLPPETTQIATLGQFHAQKQWFDDPTDPFYRTDSFMPYNKFAHAMVLQHSHSWFSGLSDEIGAGASVAMAMKNLGSPDAHEVSLIEQYATHTLWGRLQNPDYSVRAGLFYYDPKELPQFRYTVSDGWDKARSETTWRSFNYPHVTAVYWALYHLARDHQGLTHQETWDWYLSHAYHTIMAMKQFAPGYTQFGLMVGSVFPDVIRDLRREGWNDKADDVETWMREREAHWRVLRYPFGSEMPWDSTGQEEIYTWCRYFGDNDKAETTLNAILGYMPTVPNWAYNGAARRYFDAPVNGCEWPDIVRMTNHYGASINSIPVIDSFRRDPADLYLLRVGYAGMDEVLANIDQDGFASYGFDADPRHLDFDPNTADYGIAFYGYAHNCGAYAVDDPEFGWLGFGCAVTNSAGTTTILPRDGFRKRVFIAPAALWITLDSGSIQRVAYDIASKAVRVTLAPATSSSPVARLHVQTTVATKPSYRPTGEFPIDRDAMVITLHSAPVTVVLTPTAVFNGNLHR